MPPGGYRRYDISSDLICEIMVNSSIQSVFISSVSDYSCPTLYSMSQMLIVTDHTDHNHEHLSVTDLRASVM